MFHSTTDRFAMMAGRLAGVILLGGLAVGCSTPAPTTYDLSAPTIKARAATGRQLLVNIPSAVQALASQQIIAKDASGSITFLGDGQWADTLPNLVQTRLINTFENASVRGVTRPSSGAVADAQLISELRAFEIATPNDEAVVEISVKIVADQTGRIINSRIFRASAPVGAVNAASAAHALDQALSAAMSDIVRWVGTVAIPSRDVAPPTAAADQENRDAAAAMDKLKQSGQVR